MAPNTVGAEADIAAQTDWPNALEALTGQRQMDASAMADYFAPLKTWLDELDLQDLHHLSSSSS